MFSIIEVQDSDYDNNPGVMITTQEKFDIEGNEFSKFHTTRTAIVNQLKNKTLRDDISALNPLKVKCVETKNKAGKPYFVLEDVE